MMTDRIEAFGLRQRSDFVLRQLSLLPDLTRQDDGMTSAQRIALHRSFREASEGLAQRLRLLSSWPATITDGPNGARVRMMGVSTTSTGGIAAALRAWCAKAELRARSLESPTLTPSTGGPDA